MTLECLPRIDNLLRPYQKAWLKDESRFKIWLASRQIGKSWTFGWDALRESMRTGNDCLMVSASERQSILLLKKAYLWGNYISDNGRIFTLFDKNNKSKTQFGLVNGACIYSLPASADTIRGFSGNVYLDEFAFMPNPEELYSALIPTLAANKDYKLRISSTAFGEIGKFWELWENTEGFSKHKTDIETAIKQGFPVNVDDIKKIMDHDRFMREFMCCFLSDDIMFIPNEIIKPCIDDEACNIGLTNSPKYFGVDVGRRRDVTCICVIEQIADDIYVLKKIEILEGVSFPEQESFISAMIDKYNPEAVHIDQGGMGEGMVDHLAHHGCVEGHIFTNPFKNTIMVDLKHHLEMQSLKIPDNDGLIKALLKIKRKVTTAGHLKYEAKRDKSGHADQAMALALAIHACNYPEPGMFF